MPSVSDDQVTYFQVPPVLSAPVRYNSKPWSALPLSHHQGTPVRKDDPPTARLGNVPMDTSQLMFIRFLGDAHKDQRPTIFGKVALRRCLIAQACFACRDPNSIIRTRWIVRWTCRLGRTERLKIFLLCYNRLPIPFHKAFTPPAHSAITNLHTPSFQSLQEQDRQAWQNGATENPSLILPL